MPRRQLRYIVPVIAALVTGASASVAHADVFAVTDTVVAGTQQTDLKFVNTSTHDTLMLPAGINTSDNESHPSISSDGRKLVFERRNPSSGSDRIIMADLATGATSDLFTGFEAGMIHPTSPSITPDGKAVLTGGPENGPLLTDVSNFPSGPYPHTDVAGRSQTFDPVATGSASGSLLAFDEVGSGAGLRTMRFGVLGQTIFGSGGIAGGHNAHPTIASPGGVETIVFDFAGVTGGAVGKAHLLPCTPAHPVSAGCEHGSLPGLSPGTTDQSRPAFTPDGRYVGFVEAKPNGDGLVGIWDSETQTVISIFAVTPTPDDSGSLSLYERPILTLAHVTLTSGLVNFRLSMPANIGILVQKVTGHRKLFGRTVPKLGEPRRVPLGSFKSGRRHAHWNLKVGGHKLHKGTYQVTVRALTHSGRVRDLGEPQLIHIRHG